MVSKKIVKINSNKFIIGKWLSWGGVSHPTTGAQKQQTIEDSFSRRPQQARYSHLCIKQQSCLVTFVHSPQSYYFWPLFPKVSCHSISHSSHTANTFFIKFFQLKFQLLTSFCDCLLFQNLNFRTVIFNLILKLNKFNVHP